MVQIKISTNERVINYKNENIKISNKLKNLSASEETEKWTTLEYLVFCETLVTFIFSPIFNISLKL